MHSLIAIYILALSVYPCSDQETCADERIQGSTVVNVQDHNHTSEESDHCTPFCICSCCAAHIQLHYVSDITLVNLVHNTPIATQYLERHSLNNSKAIWQPPKIS
jgi:hypothetical protein